MLAVTFAASRERLGLSIFIFIVNMAAKMAAE